MDTRLSILTPVIARDARYLARLWSSLRRLDLASEFCGRWEWLIQDDSPDGVADASWLPPDALDDPRVKIHHAGRPGGAAAARNLALTRASGRLLAPVDADDEVEPAGLAALADLLDSNADLAWAAPTRWDVIDADGATVEQRRSRWPHLGGGVNLLIGPGLLRATWQQLGANPCPPNQTVYRTQAVWDAGGWPGLIIEQDLALLLRVSDRHPGGFLDVASVRARRWDGQLTAADPARDTVLAAEAVHHARAALT